MSIEWNEDINNTKEEDNTPPSSTVEMCNICRKPLEECPEWKQIQKSFKEGNYKRFNSVKEYLKELEKE